MKTLRTDLLFCLRTLWKDPVYAGATILLLALGIGANSAIFSAAHAVLLRPLPYVQPERLVVTLHDGNFPVSPADYLDYKRNVSAFEQMGAAQAWGATLTGAERAEHIPGLQVTANMMQLLGVSPTLGRWFTADEEHPGNSKVVLLSHRLWQERFGGDRNLLGREVLLDRAPYRVIGVMPPGFQFAPFWATRAQMWTPLVLDSRVQDRGGRSLRVFARLKPGVSVQQAQAQMDVVARRLAQQYPKTNAKLGISVVPLHEKVIRSVRPTLLVLTGTVGFLLLIACTTVANLMLSRAVARRKEMALRLAVGAQRSDLIRLTLAEATIVAVLGGTGSILVGHWAVQLLITGLPPDSIPRQAEVGFDGPVLIFTGAVTLVTVLLAGLIPSLEGSRADLNLDLKDGNRGSSQGVVRSRARSLFIAAEVALSLMLLAGAVLMMRTMAALQAVDAGFNPHHLLTMQVGVSGTDYDQPQRRANLFHEVREHLAAIPGVESVSAINHLPIGGDLWRLQYTIEGRPVPAPGNEMGAVYRVIMPGYLRTMQIAVLQGRDFNERERDHGARVAIINEAMAKRRWPGESAMGKNIHYGTTSDELKAALTIVGVVRNPRQSDWTSPPDDEIYLPYDQRPDSMGLSYLTFVLRTREAPEKMQGRVLETISVFNRSLPVSEVASMDQVVAKELWRQRLATVLMSGFAAVALLLALVGIYGVISYSMRQRTQEIGIRMALGAERGDLAGLALREGMQPVLWGALAGLALALSLSRLMESLLFGVKPTDPLTFAVTAFALLVICLLANLVPALRAAHVDPLVALRHG